MRFGASVTPCEVDHDSTYPFEVHAGGKPAAPFLHMMRGRAARAEGENWGESKKCEALRFKNHPQYNNAILNTTHLPNLGRLRRGGMHENLRGWAPGGSAGQPDM